MATETLRPDAAGDECNIGGGDIACPNHYQNVDEEEADDDTTRVYILADETDLRDLYNIVDHSVGSGTINKITVYARWKRYGTEGHVYIAIKTGGTAYEGAEKSQAGEGWTDWGNASDEWVDNPKTEVAWTWTDIDALQAGIRLVNLEDQGCQCTQIWVVVDYIAEYEANSAIDTGIAVTASRLSAATRTAAIDTGIAVTATRRVDYKRTATFDR